MNSTSKRSKRLLAALAVLGVAASAVAVSGGSPASALPAGTPAEGALDMTPSAGNSSTVYQLTFESGVTNQFCSGDANAGYSWSTFIVPNGTDVAALTFVGGVVADPGGSFAAPLGRSGGGFLVGQPPGLVDGFVNIGGETLVFNAPLYSAGNPDWPGAGEYELGVACFLTATGESTEYWSTTMTVTTPGGGTNSFDWSEGTRAVTPTDVTVTGTGNGTADVAFTPGASDPADTSYVATATPTDGGAVVAPSVGTGSPLPLSGLTPSATYDVTVVATNAVGDSGPSAPVTFTATSQPAPDRQTGSGGGSLTLPDITVPIGEAIIVDINPTYCVIDGVTTQPDPLPVECGTALWLADSNGDAGVVSASVPLVDDGGQPLAAGSYMITVTSGIGQSGVFVTIEVAVDAAQKIIQEITVERPEGNLILTQRCGVQGGIPAEDATADFPGPQMNSQNAATTDQVGSAPALDPIGSPLDDALGQFDSYPYPLDPQYPTYCGVSMGEAQLVSRGANAGQYFASIGRLNQVTVVDTRSVDGGWTANLQMVTDFVGQGTGNEFDAAHLGFTPYVTRDSDPNLEGYDQVVDPGAGVEPLTVTPLGNAGWDKTEVLAETPTPIGNSGGLGVAVLDARLKLLIPVTADQDTYNGTLEVTVA